MRFSLILGLAATPVFCFVFSELSTAPQLLAAPLVSQAETAATLYQTGQRLFYQGQFSQALDSLQQALQKAQAEADRQIEADAWTAIATLHLALEDKALGREAIDRALALHEDLQDPVGRAEALRVLAQAQFDVESDEAVLAIAEEALAIFRAEGAQLQEGILLADLGALAVQRQRYESGLEQLAQAAQIIEIAPAETNLERDYYRGLVLVWQGIAYIGLQDFEQAQAHIVQALTISQEASTPSVEGSARFLQGLLDEIRSDYQTALANHRSSAAIFTELGTRGALREVLVRMGEIYKSQGEAQDDHPELAISLYQNAVEVFQQALEIAAEREEGENAFNHRLTLNWLYTMISQRYMDIAITQLESQEATHEALIVLDQSIAEAQQAVEIIQPIKITDANAAQVNTFLYLGISGMARAYQLKGIGLVALLRHNDGLQAYQTALENFQAGVSYAAASQSPELNIRANQEVAKVYLSIGQAQSVLENHEAGVAAVETGLVYARRVEDLDREQMMLSLLQTLYADWGQQHRIAGEYEQALTVLRRGIASGEELMAMIKRSPSLEPDLYEQALRSQWPLYGGIALVYIDQSDYVNALDALQQTLTVVDQLDAPDLRFSTLSILATAYAQLSRYPEALDVWQQQLEVVQGSKNLENRVIMAIANLYDTMGRYPDAIAAYQQTLDWFRAQGNLRDEIIILNNLGLIRQQQGESAQALETLNQALDLNHRLRIQLEAPDAIAQLNTLCPNDLPSEDESADEQSSAGTILAGVGEQLHQQGREEYRQGCLETAWAIEQATLNNIAIVYADQGRYREALDLHQEALEIVRSRLRDRNSEASNLGNMSSIYWQQGDYAQALELQQQALEIYQATGAQDGVVNSLNDIGVIYLYQGLYPQALKTLEQALSLAQEIKLKPSEVSILGNLGTVYDAQGQYDRAEEYYRDSLGLSRELGLKSSEATAFTNLGILSGKRGQYAQALAFEQRALSIFEAIGSIGSVASARLALGAYQRAQGYYVEALDQQRQALEDMQKISNRDDEAYALAELGLTYLELGQADKALQHHQAALAIYRDIGDRSGEAKALGLKGLVYDDQGQYQQALQAYEQSLAIRRDIGDVAGESISLTHLGFTYEQLGDYAAARAAFQQALEIQQQIGARGREGLTLNGLALAYAGQGNYTEALDLQQQSLALHRELGDRPNEAKVLSDMGRLFADQDQPELAIVFLKASVNLTETLRGELQSLSTEDQASFAESVSDRYRCLADLLIQAGRIPEAQRVLDLLKIEEIREFTRNTRASWTTDGIALNPLEQQIVEIHGGLIALGQKIYTCEQSNCPNSELNSYYRDQQKLVASYNEQVAKFETTVRDNRYNDDFFYNPDNLSDSARDIVEAPHTMLIYPFVLEETLWLLWTTAGGVVGTVEVDVSQAELSEIVRQFGEQLANPNEFPLTDLQATSNVLYNWLIQPLEVDLEKHSIKRLVFAQDRVTRYIPMAALYDGEQYLVERYTLSTILSAEWTDTKDRLTTVADTPVLGLGVSQSVSGFSALPNVQSELNGIIRETNDPGIYPGRIFLDNAFDFEALWQNARNYRILHIATHAEFVPGALDQSYLVLGNGVHLKINEIKTIGRQLKDVHLVVLSACETALGEENVDGREIAGLSAYFLAPNRAKSVLASLWQVADDSTSLLMQAFYTKLAADNLSKAEALQRVQMAFIQNEDEMASLLARGGFESITPAIETASLSHPYYWAPFILIGNRL